MKLDNVVHKHIANNITQINIQHISITLKSFIYPLFVNINLFIDNHLQLLFLEFFLSGVIYFVHFISSFSQHNIFKIHPCHYAHQKYTYVCILSCIYMQCLCHTYKICVRHIQKVSCSFLLLHCISLYEYIRICLSILLLKSIQVFPVWVIMGILVQLFSGHADSFLLKMYARMEMMGHILGCI